MNSKATTDPNIMEFSKFMWLTLRSNQLLDILTQYSQISNTYIM